MKKLFLLMTTVMMLSAIGVFADDQPVIVDVGENIHVAILPNPLDFGSILPGTSNAQSTQDITFNAAGSNVNVHIAISDVTGVPFSDGLKIGGSSPVGQFWDLLCISDPTTEICTYDLVTADPTLDIPLGTSQGSKAGAIVYTVTGPAP